jgi:hypothetical protein
MRGNMDLLSELISSFDPEYPNFRPTELYNEGWFVKLVLHQASMIEDEEFLLGFLPRSTWFSEGLLPTAFKATFKGDPLSESRTNADGVIGHIQIGRKAKADLELEPDATQFTVVEAKIGAPLSSGVSHAKYFDQAARNVACMAEVMARAKVDPSSLRRLEFIVLAPQYSIEKGTFAEEMKPNSIRAKVRKRVSAYDGQLDDWYTKHFEPTMDRIQLHSLSWESAIAWIGEKESRVADKLSDFYELCLEFS